MLAICSFPATIFHFRNNPSLIFPQDWFLRGDESGFTPLLCRRWRFQAACVEIKAEAAAPPLPTLRKERTPKLSMSRRAIADAQKALFDYLYSTRVLSFADADHISKNCPVFLRELFESAGVDNKTKDVGRSITRFLQFSCINEFEAFFESIGLERSKLVDILPKDMIFLSDDPELLENYKVLCNYGIPRSKIGRIYKAGRPMFRYSHGVLHSKLEAYEKLNLEKMTVIKLITCCPQLIVGDIDPAFLEVLSMLKSLGVDFNHLRAYLSDKGNYNWARVREMLMFLKATGCEEVKLATLINEYPILLFHNSEKLIYPLVGSLMEFGATIDDIMALFTECPGVLYQNSICNLSRWMKFLKDESLRGKDVAKIVSSRPDILKLLCCYKRPSTMLFDMITEDSSKFGSVMVNQWVGKGGIFLWQKTEFLLKLGYVENSEEMLRALPKFHGGADRLEERFKCLLAFGLDFHVACSMARRVPDILSRSPDNIKAKLEYLINDLNYPVESVAVFPTYLNYSMVRIKLRFAMYRWLMSKGVTMPTKNRKMKMQVAALSTILIYSESRFVQCIVNRHPDGIQEWERLKRLSGLNVVHL